MSSRMTSTVEKFLSLATEIATRYEVAVIGYCLMGNHVHLLVIAGPGGLSRFMQVLLGRYSRWANRRHGSDGGIFETRFHATPVVGDGHLWKAASYIDLNPVKDAFVERAGGVAVEQLPSPRRTRPRGAAPIAQTLLRVLRPRGLPPFRRRRTTRAGVGHRREVRTGV